MEGYVLVDNGRLTEKEARLNMEQCADFLARMIQKYGPEILAELKEKDAKEYIEECNFLKMMEGGVKIPMRVFSRERRGGHTHKNKKSNGVLPGRELR